MPQNFLHHAPSVGIYYTEPEQKNKAEQLAAELGLPLTCDEKDHDLLLGYFHDRLSLYNPAKRYRKAKVYADFTGETALFRRKHGKKELLLKAIGLRKGTSLSVLDATGGLGRDGFLMAAHGCIVHIIERHSVVAALLADGLQRASKNPDTKKIADRIEFSVGDTTQYLRDAVPAEFQYDVIYLDPMFPERNKSALVKKEMQLLQRLIGHGEDVRQLFETALHHADNRVVVKRPVKAPHIGTRDPSHCIKGKTTRYDVYMV